jgi:ubiquinone/menaquinone biosynthesis C-methylase UbiE
MSERKGYVDSDYLDLTTRLMGPGKRRSYELMNLTNGQRALDLGCGPASDTITMAALVGEAGEVHGLDHDEQMVTQANERAVSAGVNQRVFHRLGVATDLPWPDGFFDSCRSERVFLHLMDPAKAFRELIRVTRTGGWIVIVDGDWATLTIDCDEPEIERRLSRFNAERMLNNPYSGRTLYRMFKTSGLIDISLDVWAFFTTDYGLACRLLGIDLIGQGAAEAKCIDSHELRRWQASLERGAAADAFYAGLNQVSVAGRKTEQNNL